MESACVSGNLLYYSFIATRNRKQQMNSQQVKQAFKTAGIVVRVSDLGAKFRVCTVSGIAFDRAAALTIASALGLTDVLANVGGQFNQSHEFIGYKPGAVVRK